MKFEVNERNVLLIGTLLAIAAPFLLVTYVPSTDLPQHLAQVRLLFDVLRGNHQTDLTLNLFAPNILVYLPLSIAWLVFPPVLAGKVVMLFLIVASALSTLVFALKNGRSIESAALVSILVFNASFYWGFVNFLIGWPFFLWWMHLLTHRERVESGWRHVVVEGVVALLLFLSHALWFAAGVGVMVFLNLLDRFPRRRMFRHALALAPELLISMVWYPRMSSARASLGFDTAAHWYTMPLDRFSPAWLVDSMMGGLMGPAESILCAAIVIWIGLCIVTNIRKLRDSVDPTLLIAGGLILLFVLLAPDKYMNTIGFASRWLPMGITLIVLGLPRPRVPAALSFSFPLLILVVFSLVTSNAWRNFDSRELDGFSQALQAVPDNGKVLGLDFVRQSEQIKGQPFMQLFSYAQVLHGGELNFSFTMLQSEIVVLEKLPTFNFTLGLEWLPELATKHDYDVFDVTVVNAYEDEHRAIDSSGLATPLTFRGMWRAYGPRR